MAKSTLDCEQWRSTKSRSSLQQVEIYAMSAQARQDCMDSRIFEICGRLPDLQDLQQAVAAHELCTAWSERISALELSQKTMAEAVRRALQTAIAAQEVVAVEL
eukprot:6293007-Amphidinium_carterae.1